MTRSVSSHLQSVKRAVVARRRSQAFTPELPARPMRGHFIESPEIPNGAGSLLWVHESGVHTLEVFAYADPFLEQL